METVQTGALKTQLLDYTDNDTTFEGYVAYEMNVSSPTPCVLVAHDWSGLNQATREVTEKLASLGYVGFAVDVYGKGVRGSLTGDNSALMNPLMEDRLLLRRRLVAGFTAAQSHPRVDRNRMAIVGYCFGGLCALDLARAAPFGLKGAATFHGVLTPPNVGEQAPIQASILILHGWEDPFAPQADVQAVANELTASGADWQIHIYGHAKHAFTFKGANFPERGMLYDAAADRRSWASMKSFLSEVIQD